MDKEKDWSIAAADICQSAMDSISEMVEALKKDLTHETFELIQDDPLSVQVGASFQSPGVLKADRFEILLSTGGPATRIIGELSEDMEPISAVLQAQDWFQPWTSAGEQNEDHLIQYASCFYFGE